MMMMMTMIMIMMILHMRIDELEGQFSLQFELAGVNSSSSIINKLITFKKGKYNPRCCCSIVVNFENFKDFCFKGIFGRQKIVNDFINDFLPAGRPAEEGVRAEGGGSTPPTA